jgi:hypothetical protein
MKRNLPERKKNRFLLGSIAVIVKIAILMEETHWICSVLLQNYLFHAVFFPTYVLMVHAEDARSNPYRSSCEVFSCLCPTLTKAAM